MAKSHMLTSKWIIYVVIVLACFHTAIASHDSNTTTSPVSATTSPPTTTLRPTTTRAAVLHDCEQWETKFEQTKCSKDKHRWVVKVPKTFGVCELSNPPAPVQGIDCGFVCPTGNYLDLATKSCLPCKAGTYSIGGRISFNSWDKLQPGFHSWSVDPDDDSPDASEASVCKDKKWDGKGDFIASSGDECKSVLAYSVELERAGNMTFSYRSQTDSSYFHVYTKDGTCTKKFKPNQQLFPRLSTEWQVATMPLDVGRNIIFWEAAYFDTTGGALSDALSGDKHNYESSDEKKIEIRSIVVTGLPYTPECKPCEPGTYSGPGSSLCKKCDKNTFSKAGAQVCTQCSTSEYAEMGSGVCSERPLCTESDYYETWTSCDENMKTQHIFDWVRPKICNSDLEGSIALPRSSGKVDCPPCNPGNFLNGSVCSFCPTGMFGDGAKACQKCPVSTTPKTGLYYRYWTGVNNDLVKFGCFSKFVRACKSKLGWVLTKKYAESGIGHSDDAELVMTISVPKFKKEHSLFIMEFDLTCESQCLLTLSEYHYRRGVQTVRSWHGSKRKMKFIHHIKSSEEIKFRLSFERPFMATKMTHKYKHDRVRLYSLNITNALNGGANECEDCSLGIKNSRCTTCGNAKYLDSKMTCQTCPDGFFFNATVGLDIKACQKCPTGSTVNPSGTGCYSNCHVYFGERHFDLSKLAGPMLMTGATLFTGKGFPYYHVFNVSVCGMDRALVSCQNNESISKDDDPNDSRHSAKILAAVCRSTVIPSKVYGNLLTQSVSLAEDIGSIHYGDIDEATMVTLKRQSRATNDSNEASSNSTHKDIHFIFKSSTLTPHCTNGFRSIVTLRCDPTAKDKGIIKPPSDAPYGTKDGCLFNFIWYTENACPQCTALDYINITAACKDGKVVVHHNWKENPRMCRGGVSLPAVEKRACTIFETPILDFKIFLMIFLCLAVLLCMLVLFLCYRNRRLQYKYHRLVDGAALTNGELPAAEKCTLEEGEEDEDEIILARNPRGTNHILDRLKKFKGKQNFDEFESMQMKTCQSDDDDFGH